MDPTKKPAPDAQGEADDSAQADDRDATLNSALTSRDKRLRAATSKTLEEQLAKLSSTREAKPAQEQPADGVKG